MASENYDYSGESGGPSYYGYEKDGKLVAKRFVRSDGLVTETSFLYDARRRLTRSYRIYADGRHGVFRYAFDGAGRLVERTLLEADVQTHPDDARLHASLAVAHAGLGNKREALRAGRHAVEMLPIEKDAFVGAWLTQDLAWTYAMTGELDVAVEAFDRVLSVPSIWSIQALQLDPRTESLRDHAGFRELVRKHTETP